MKFCTIAQLLETTLRSAYQDELALQNAIEIVLGTAMMPYVREYRLGINDRPDFWLYGTVVEVKVDGSSSSVARQLRRYATHKCVKQIVLVTTKRTHRIDYSAIGKPVDVVVLDRGLC